MKRIFLLYLFILIVDSFQQVYAQSKEIRLKNIEAAVPVLDKIVADHASKNHLPGLVYGLVVDGKLVHSWSTGFVSISGQEKVNSHSAFRIASMTKSFTAMAILKLRDEGKLKLDDAVSLYIPEMKDQKYLTTDAPEITIRHLLTHSGGLPEDNPWGDRQLAATDDDLIALIKKGISFSNAPGVTYEYSNLAFTTLGYIIKKISGVPYQEYIAKNILAPLGMKHTYWEYDRVPVKDLVQGYRWVNGKWMNEPMLHDGAYGAMGGMITTMEDFSQYVALHLSAWPARNDEDTGPVKRSSLREMQFPWNFSGLNAQYKYPGGRSCALVSAYGYGLSWNKDCNGRVFLGHSGGLPGFGSNWKILPEYGIGVISFSNCTYAPMNALNMQILDTLIAMAGLEPAPLPVSAILNQRKDELMTLLPGWDQTHASGIFADNFFLDNSLDSLKIQTMRIFKDGGRIVRVGQLIPENNLRGSFIVEGEDRNIGITFTLTPQNPPLIQELQIRGLDKKPSGE